MVQLAQAYFDALYNDAPEEHLDRVRRYMKDLDALIAVTTMGGTQGMLIPGAPGGGEMPGEGPAPMAENAAPAQPGVPPNVAA
jgi:hypothetical protein